MDEMKIINQLSRWLETYLGGSDLLIESEATVKLGNEVQKMQVDLLVIQ